MLTFFHFDFVKFIFEIVHIEEPLHFQLLGNFHDARYLRLRDIHLAGVHVLDQRLHFEWPHFWEDDDTMLHGDVLQDRLKIWRIGGQNNAMSLEFHIIVDVYCAIGIFILVDERMQNFH